MIGFIRKYQFAIFFILTFAIFWLSSPLAVITPVLPGIIASFAPSVVSVLVTRITSGNVGVRALVGRLGIWRVGPGWYLAAAGIPLFISLLILGSAAGSDPTRTSQVGLVLPYIPIIYLLAAGEELGWRGYALPKLLARFPALVAAVLLGLIHAGYHLPLWFAPGFPTPSYSFLSFLFTSLAFGMIWTWLYQHTRGSVLIATVFHGSINTAGNLFFAGLPAGLLSWLMPAGYGLIAIGILVLYGYSLTDKPFTMRARET